MCFNFSPNQCYQALYNTNISQTRQALKNETQCFSRVNETQFDVKTAHFENFYILKLRVQIWDVYN